MNSDSLDLAILTCSPPIIYTPINNEKTGVLFRGANRTVVCRVPDLLFRREFTGSNSFKKGKSWKEASADFFEVSATNIGTGEDFYILVIDSGSDKSVISDIKELYQNLVNQNYSLVVGVRDVRPDFSRREIRKLRLGLYSSIPTIPQLPVEFHLAIMEVEAWFLAENTHFERFDRRLTQAKIEAELGFFPDDNIAETRECPSDDLDKIHQTIGKRYDKSHAVVSKIVSSLNYQNLVDLHSLKIADLGGLVNDLYEFFKVDV